jgi:hypothetical protein
MVGICAVALPIGLAAASGRVSAPRVNMARGILAIQPSVAPPERARPHASPVSVRDDERDDDAAHVSHSAGVVRTSRLSAAVVAVAPVAASAPEPARAGSQPRREESVDAELVSGVEAEPTVEVPIRPWPAPAVPAAPAAADAAPVAVAASAPPASAQADAAPAPAPVAAPAAAPADTTGWSAADDEGKTDD